MGQTLRLQAEQHEESIRDIALSCITFTNRCEGDIAAVYFRRCIRKRIVPLFGQLLAALKSLKKDGKIELVVIDGHLLCRKTRK